MQIVALFKSKDIKNYGLFKFFEPLIDDVKILETNGISFIHKNRQYTLYGTITFISADNLAAHSLGCFYENFSSAKKIYRTCMVSRNDMNDNFNENYYILRTIESYNKQAKYVDMCQSLTNVYGIKQNSPLNKLKYLHVINALPHDISHDLFEGVMPETVKYVISGFIKYKNKAL